MEGSSYALIELLLSFGLLVAFIHWQLHGLKKRARLRAEGKLPDERADRRSEGTAPPP